MFEIYLYWLGFGMSSMLFSHTGAGSRYGCFGSGAIVEVGGMIGP